MLLPAPPLYPRKRRPRPRKTTRVPTPPPVALELVAGVWEVGGLVTLTFDRAVDVAGIVPGAFIVHDGPTGFSYQGNSVYDHSTPQTVTVEMGGIAEYEGATVLLDVGAENGIVAVDDGGPWAGVNDVVLPVSIGRDTDEYD